MLRPEVAFDPQERRSARVVLIGYMGAGKTTIAEGWAANGLPVLWFDSDRAALQRLGADSIAEVFQDGGEARFRATEREVIVERAEPLQHGLELWSLGGGAVMEPDVQRLLFDSVVVWLDAQPELLWERAVGTDRPLARDREEFIRRYEARRATYESLATVRLPTDEEVDAAAVARVLGDHMSPEVFAGALAVAPGVLQRVEEVAAFQDAPVALVADRAVEDQADGIRARLEGSGVEVVSDDRLAMGEWNKQLATSERLWERWSSAGLHRGGVVVAVGGGTLLDVAGFAASTYQRGVRWVAVPTTVTAQVDAAIGGKTGVNLGVVKNVVGTVHFPVTTLVDVDALATLPAELRREGLAEAIKTGLLAGDWLLDQVRELVGSGLAFETEDESTTRAWADVVAGCAAWKATVVEEDVEDLAGVRAQLNLGHTLGHALEAATGGAVSHGSAVAVGTRAALEISCDVLGTDRAVLDSYVALCAAAGLPTTTDVPWTRVEPFLRHDKKRTSSGIGWVLLERVGQAITEATVADEVVRAAWSTVQAGAPSSASAPSAPRSAGAPSSAGARATAGGNRVLVLFGVNLGQLGSRDAEHYGSQTLPKLVAQVEQWAHAAGLVADCRQTDSLERFLAALHEASHAHAAVIVNPGAWTHHELALRDALEPLAIPRVEVHLSDVDNREEFRRTSVVADVVDHRISGAGAEGYRQALHWIRAQLPSTRR